MKSKKLNYKQYKKYIVKDSEGLSEADIRYFDSIKSWVEALSIGVCIYAEIYKLLTDDAITGSNSYIGNMKVTTGLERSLQELNERYPGLLNELHSTSLVMNGLKINRC